MGNTDFKFPPCRMHLKYKYSHTQRNANAMQCHVMSFIKPFAHFAFNPSDCSPPTSIFTLPAYEINLN